MLSGIGQESMLLPGCCTLGFMTFWVSLQGVGFQGARQCECWDKFCKGKCANADLCWCYERNGACHRQQQGWGINGAAAYTRWRHPKFAAEPCCPQPNQLPQIPGRQFSWRGHCKTRCWALGICPGTCSLGDISDLELSCWYILNILPCCFQSRLNWHCQRSNNTFIGTNCLDFCIPLELIVFTSCIDFGLTWQLFL